MITRDNLPFTLDDSVWGFHVFNDELLIVEHKVERIAVDKKSSLYELLFLELERLIAETLKFSTLVLDYGADYVVTRKGLFFKTELAAENHRDAMLL